MAVRVYGEEVRESEAEAERRRPLPTDATALTNERATSATRPTPIFHHFFGQLVIDRTQPAPLNLIPSSFNSIDRY